MCKITQWFNKCSEAQIKPPTFCVQESFHLYNDANPQVKNVTNIMSIVSSGTEHIMTCDQQ